MYNISEEILNHLELRSKYVVPVVEFYPRAQEDLVSIHAPQYAVGRFSNTCFDWQTSENVYSYDAKVLEFPSIEMFIDEELNNAEIVFSNVKRGEGSFVRFCLDNHIKGMWMVIRLIFPELEDESIVVFWGKCNRPGGINNEEITITATQDMGNHQQKIPFRTYGPNCPLDFAKPLGGCLGDETLLQKSPAYQQAVALYGSAGCNKRYSTCATLGNTEYFQGQRVVAVSGQFSYITVEEVIKRVLFWTKRKKINVVKTENWSSTNQSEGNETVPIAFGRCQIEGHPFVWADTGTQVRGLYGFCEGKISAFTFIRSRTEGINIVYTTEHLGDWGGKGTQQPDLLFGGVSGTHSRLAYVEITTDGSSPTQVDDAPLVTAVIRGLEIPVPDINGEFTLEEWSNNPAYISRFLLTDTRFGRVPASRIDDEECYITGLDCDEIVEDRTNEEAIVLPSNEANNYDIGYRRFRSSGRWTVYKDMFVRGEFLAGEYPEFEHPEVRWFNPFLPYTIPVQQNVLRQKYTCNGALQEETSVFDFLFERILPTFKGYIDYGFNGKIKIKNRRKADNAYIRVKASAGGRRVPVTNILKWRQSFDGFLLLGVSLDTAEVRRVEGVEYSTACNGLPITGSTNGALTITTSNVDGGSNIYPAEGYIQLDGAPGANEKITITVDSGDSEFVVTYTTDGIEDLAATARMIAAFLNANVQFHSYLTAFIRPTQPNRIVIRCESGSLIVDRPLQYDHFNGEEVMRVQAVFENCGELTANDSAQFDNIIADSFNWNEQDSEEINAVTAKYTSAVDDFRASILMPRAAWDTIDLEGELAKEELDLTFVDNYWQAAYLAKGEAIDRIDGNIHFTFSTRLRDALGLELGDVVAVKHDSGDGALNYVPVWITKKGLNLDQFTIDLGAKLYLSAAFDYHVSPIDALLTTTLNTEDFPETLPDTLGSSGGVGGGTEPVIDRPPHDYYSKFSGLNGVYSPDGRDIV
jgi:hypothetical protein